MGAPGRRRARRGATWRRHARCSSSDGGSPRPTPRRLRLPAGRTLAAALTGFFVLTLDALVASVALPAIRDSLGGGIAGLQWVMDAYTLPFAALLLVCGALSDRIGARRAFGGGLVLFVVSSVGCALAPSLAVLIVARFLQGAGAALMTPASLALIGEAYPEPSDKARAIGVWAVGGGVASAAGPLIGGALTAVSWRLIFLINLPVGAFALWLLAGVPASERRAAPVDWPGQLSALVALSALTYGLIEAGEVGLAHPAVLASLTLAGVAGALFVALQARVEHPLVPLELFRSRLAATSIAIGFSFMLAFFGMVFVVSLLLQEQRGLTPLQTGLAFLPVTGITVFVPLLAARAGERWGPWVPIVGGQASMAAGLTALGLLADTASVPVLVACMVPVGCGGGAAMPSATALLLNAVPAAKAGTASGVLNTARQVGGALAIAAFGALIGTYGYGVGVRISLFTGAGLLVLTLLASLRLRAHTPAQRVGPPAREPLLPVH
ncbi:MAG: MFS transporter [Planctomycetota bacterium]